MNEKNYNTRPSKLINKVHTCLYINTDKMRILSTKDHGRRKNVTKLYEANIKKFKGIYYRM